MIELIDVITGEFFDLGDKISISIEKITPFEITQGTVSLPIKLPWTKKNLRLLDHPEQIENIYRPTINRRILIRKGSYNREGDLMLVRIGIEKYIETSIRLEESSFYYRAHNTQMPTVFKNVVRNDFNVEINGIEFAVGKWMEHFEKVMTGIQIDDFFVFEILCSDDLSNKKYTSLNGHSNVFAQGLDFQIGYPALDNKTATSQTITIGGEEYEIEFLKGHNTTPFLKLSFVLNHVFNYFGLTLNQLPLVNFHYNNAAVLNNTADAIVAGAIKYEQLVPTCSVASFLKSVSILLSCGFDINGTTATPVFWNDILNIDSGKQYKSISDKFTSQPEITPISPVALKLSSKSEFKKIEFKKPHEPAPQEVSTILNIGDYHIPSSSPINTKEFIVLSDGSNIVATGLHPICARLNFSLPPLPLVIHDPMTDYDPVKAAIFDNASNATRQYLSANITKYQEDNAEFRSGKEVDEKVLSSDHTAVSDVNQFLESTDPIIQGTDQHYTFEKSFIGNIRRLNSSMVSEQEPDEDKKIKDDCPIILAYYRRGIWMHLDDFGKYGCTYYGSSRSIRLTDEGTIDESSIRFQGDFGVYNRLYKLYADVLKNSCYKIKASIMLESHEIDDFRLLEALLVNGQPTLPESIRYSIKNKSFGISEAIFRTLRKYETPN